ncbi:MAG: hypothetical protein ACLT1W_05150 [Alistipes onderdonkii]
MTLVGPVDADLEVTLSTTDADFVVKLIDLFPRTIRCRATGCSCGATSCAAAIAAVSRVPRRLRPVFRRGCLSG